MERDRQRGIAKSELHTYTDRRGRTRFLPGRPVLPQRQIDYPFRGKVVPGVVLLQPNLGTSPCRKLH